MTPRRDSREAGWSGRRKSLGTSGESVARKYLEANGFRVIGVNFRGKRGEIDIVARARGLIVFCEVKTRVGSGNPVEGYGERQQRRLVRTSEAYLAMHADILPKVYDLRYDLIVVGYGPDGVLEVKEHIADAFRPSSR